MQERIALVGPDEAGTTNKALPFAAALINKEPMHNTPFHGTWLQPLRLGPALFALLLATSCGTIHQPNRMTKIEEQDWGRTPDGTPVKLFTLTNSKGMVAKITTYGGIVTELRVPDRDGHIDDVVLGFDNLDQYLKGHPFFGAIAGRVANRIAKGRFTLDEHEYTLATNNGPNHLHGGIKGFDKVVWEPRILNANSNPSLALTYLSKDGEEG